MVDIGLGCGSLMSASSHGRRGSGVCFAGSPASTDLLVVERKVWLTTFWYEGKLLFDLSAEDW